METETCLRLAVATICLLAAKMEAKEFACDFSGADDVVTSVPAFAVGDKVMLAGPGGISFALEIVSAPPAGIAGRSFIATDAATGASAIIKPAADGLRITVDDFAGNNIHSFRIKNGVKSHSMREKSTRPDECATCNALDGANGLNALDGANGLKAAKALKALGDANSPFPLADQKAIIDVLVAFDRGAKAWAESANWPDGDTIEEFADYAIAKMNYVLEMSQLADRFCYRLVGVVEVDATFPKIENSVLLELSAGSGAFAPVAAMREKCGADTTTLLVNRTSGTTSGIGFPLQSTNDNAFAAFAAANKNCNVCDINTVASRYTMSHETGHNMGCGHSNTQGANSGPETGPFPYSCGYHFTANGLRYHTVMAYQYDGSGNRDYIAVPYFSSPDITPDDLGVPLGVEGVNDNRQVLAHTHKGVETYREHVLPYAWDVRFLDDNGNDIPSGTYFVNTLYVTLTNDNPDATIYYTFDGSTPGPDSYNCPNGQRFTLYESKKITACAVTNGVAMSVRTAAFNAGQLWSGESGRNGSGRWADDDTVLAWDNPPHAYDTWTPVVFHDIPSCSAATVSVCGVAAPYGSAFPATDTDYTFEKGTTDASIHLRDASFAPSGDLTFNVPVQLDAVAFTNPASHTLAFNAPFGQEITETTGYCTNMIGVGDGGTIVVSPGEGKTQYFNSFNNQGWHYKTAQLRVGSGTVVFTGPVNATHGLFGSTKIDVADGAKAIFDVTGKIGGQYQPPTTGSGTIVCKAVASANSLKLTDSGWDGVLAFEGLAADSTTQNFQFELYGNANSRVLLRNCTISYLNDNNATFPGTLVLEKDAGGHAAFTTVNGSSGKYNVFGALEGDGAMSFATGQRQGYVFNVATNYTGGISVGAQNNYGVVGGRYIVFGQVASAGDLPSQSATITVKTGATASIGGGATWSAYNGIDIAGTLLVKGANATLDCDTSASMGLKLEDGATLRFETADASLTLAKAPSFVSGTNYIAFANGVSPTNGTVLVVWPDGSAPGGDLAFADTAVAAKWALDKTSTGLVVKKAPLPAEVPVSITLRYWNEDAGRYEDRAFAFNLPTEWATNHYPMLDTVEAVSAKYADTAANGATVWQCYMLGLDPTDVSSRVSLAMEIEGDTIHFAVTGLGETHAVAGISVDWYMKTSTNLVTDAGFTRTRASASGLSPVFNDHSMPDTPAENSPETSDTLFYKVNATFVAE